MHIITRKCDIRNKVIECSKFYILMRTPYIFSCIWGPFPSKSVPKSFHTTITTKKCSSLGTIPIIFHFWITIFLQWGTYVPKKLEINLAKDSFPRNKKGVLGGLGRSQKFGNECASPFKPFPKVWKWKIWISCTSSLKPAFWIKKSQCPIASLKSWWKQLINNIFL